ncbi:MAG: restriction endonuclease subunit S [Thermodesulfobacteriota bacterium]
MGSFISLDWHWPKGTIRPLADALSRKIIPVDAEAHSLDEIRLVTLHFDGEMEHRQQTGANPIKGKLWWADPGDVIYSKIDVRNGAIGIVPNELGRVCVTSEYPVYAVDPATADARYVKLLFRTNTFRRKINGMISGASGRKRVQPTDLEEIKVPLPSLSIQRAIVSVWEQAQAELAKTRQHIAQLEADIEADFLADLGLPKPKRATLPRILAVWWKDLERWSVMFNQLASGGVDISAGRFPVSPLAQCLTSTTNGYCIKPVSQVTPYKMLKLNALQPGGLDVSQSKFVKVTPKIAERFHIAKNDLLICRSVGSFDHVAKCALVEEDHPDILFPDIIIRVRFNARIDPRYAREVIQTSVGRAWFQKNARTAVGMWKIGGGDIEDFPMPLPPLPVQRELVAKIAVRREQIAALKAQAAQKEERAKAEVEAMVLGERLVPVRG